MVRFHSFADNLVGKVLTVAPQCRGHSQMYPYARVASDRHEVGIGGAEMTG